MSGLCGIVLHDRSDQFIPGHLSLMVRALGIFETGEDFTITLGLVGIGVQSSPGRLTGLGELTIQGQPLALAFYGSLYNLKELFSLAGEASDLFTALLRLYLREGITFVQRLRGEFALSLWDGRRDTLYLITDRFRVHPLFYYQDQDKLIFASSMKGLLACPLLVRRTINPEAIVDVVASSFIPTPKTIFQEVKKLPPGHILTLYKGEITSVPYWEIDFLQPDAMAATVLTCRLKACLTEALSIRLDADKVSDRIGTFLSGGIDSSTITGILTQLAKRSIKTFSIGFAEETFNEINYARIAARTFGAEHYEYFVTPQDTYDAVPILLAAFDEPYANASAIPTYFCAKLAREHGVETLYAGDGGDELFAGNERYATQRVFDYYYRIPVWLRKPFVEPLVFTIADRLQWEFFVKGKKYIQRAHIPYPDRLFSYGLFQLMAMRGLLAEELLEGLGKDYDPYAAIRFHYHQAPAQSELDRQLYIDLKLAISDNDLFKVIRMTEAAGVTVRFPFLDHRLAEFAATIPTRVKMPGRNLRAFFKKAYADLLPVEIRMKKKHGFGLPIPVWLRTDQRLNDMMYDLVLSPQSIQRGYFRKNALEDLVKCHKTDETSFYGTILWNLMILESWHRTYC